MSAKRTRTRMEYSYAPAYHAVEKEEWPRVIIMVPGLSFFGASGQEPFCFVLDDIHGKFRGLAAFLGPSNSVWVLSTLDRSCRLLCKE
jgi:hypothetical protein